MGELGRGKGFRCIGWTDLNGKGDGSQVQVKRLPEHGGRRFAYVAHMGEFETALSVVDVTNPAAPEVVHQIPTPTPATHCHKVQVRGNLLIMNCEKRPRVEGEFVAGIWIYDLRDPGNPQPIRFFSTGGVGVHRMWFTGEILHAASGFPGYDDQIYLILDLHDPERPSLLGRWAIPEEWKRGQAGDGRRFRVHHVIPDGSRAYVACWDAGMAILDISDPGSIRVVAHFHWSPPYGGATHTVLPLKDRGIAVVTEEAMADLCKEDQKHVWIVDIREEGNPIPIATCPVPEGEFCKAGGRFGPHNLHENYPGSAQCSDRIFVTYYNAGLRAFDLRNPYRPEEIGWFIPETPPGTPKGAPQVNDVYVDQDGLVYITDRHTGGLYVLEYHG
ncbi:MAG: hypothetical protein QN189_09360 [Armatimonadota bacterium]|nr:hypothetical protein [Armatimonadota bacterium]